MGVMALAMALLLALPTVGALAGETPERGGILNSRVLHRILEAEGEDGYHYPRDKHRYVVELMKKFELCYQLSPQRLLVPDLLPVQQPDYELADGDEVRVIFDYDYLPRSVLPRLIVNLHHINHDPEAQIARHRALPFDGKEAHNGVRQLIIELR